MKNYLLKINTLLLLATIICSVTYSYQYFTERNRIFNINNEKAHLETDKAASKIKKQINYLIETGEQLKQTLTGQVFNGSKTDQQIKLKLKNILAENNKRQEGKIFAVGIALDQGIFTSHPNDLIQPDKYDLKSWYAYQKNNQIKIKTKEYDYTETGKKQTAWYTKAVELGKPVWQEPKFSRTSGAYIIGYSIPFYTAENHAKIAGVITLNYSITELKLIMRARGFWKTGYGFIVSKQGNLIYHPNEHLAKQEVTNNQISKIQYAAEKDDLLSYFLAKDQYINNDNNPLSRGQAFTTNNLDALVFSKKIASTNWLLHVVFIKDEQGFNSPALHNLYLRLITSITITLASLVIFIIYKKYYWSKKNTAKINIKTLWFIALSTSCIALAGLSLIAIEANINLLDNNQASVQLIDKNDIKQAKEQYLDYSKKIKQKQAKFVKTGIHINSLNYVNNANLALTGFIWQKYKLIGTPHFSNQQKGVILSNVINGQLFYRYEDRNYTYRNNDIETIGWYFKVQLAQEINHSTYPFDSGLISLKLQHLDFNNNIVLEPDIEAYPLIYRTARPGLQSNISLPDWNIISSYFSLHKSDYSSNMGINNYIERYSLADMHFNIAIQRLFITPLITHIAPMVMVFITLFLLVLLSTNNSNRATKLGFNPMTVIAASIALLFSTMLWHSSLRAVLASGGISYYECYYFLAYLMIALVSINSVILADQNRINFVNFKDNLLPKMLYWPLLTGTLFLITLIKIISVFIRS